MGHWYTKEGEAMHFIEGANGKQRDTTLRDARKHNLLPSVTTILGVIDKPALTGWKLKQVTKAAFVFDSDMETPDDYHKEIMQVAFTDSTDARDRGSEIHDCLELIVGGNPKAKKDYPDDIYQIADKAFNALIDYCETSRFTPEQIVVGDGFAGKIDAYNDEFIIDWKTKDGIEEGGRYHYPEMAMQLAAYSAAMEEITLNGSPPQSRKCLNVFIDRQTGETVIHEWRPEEIAIAWDKFRLLTKYWQLDKNYTGAE